MEAEKRQHETERQNEEQLDERQRSETDRQREEEQRREEDMMFFIIQREIEAMEKADRKRQLQQDY